jgi:hypothetical protein
MSFHIRMLVPRLKMIEMMHVKEMMEMKKLYAS